MRSALCIRFAIVVLAGLLRMTAAESRPWFYHVKTGGTGGIPIQNEADPDLSFCWGSINAAFAAVQNRTTPGPWIIQVDDEATYDEAVVLSGLQTSPKETFTLTKAPWLTGRPTIYPRQLFRRALYISGLWPETGEGLLVGGMTYVTIRGLILKNNASGTDQSTELNLFFDNQEYMSEGWHTIEDCVFDGQGQVYDSRVAIHISGTSINTIFRRNLIVDFQINQTNLLGVVFLMSKPVAEIVGSPGVIIADNTFCGNHGLVAEFVSDSLNGRYFTLVFERNKIIRNSAVDRRTVSINYNARSNVIQNNIFADNSGYGGSLSIYDSSNTKIYHNTFFNNHMDPDVVVWGKSSSGVEIKNNIFWPTPGCLCVDIGRECTKNLVSANNAFFSDFDEDGYPLGSGLSTNENTEVIGRWNEWEVTTQSWNRQSKLNSGNGYAIGGLGLNWHLHPVAGSLCIDAGVSGLVQDDFDGGRRPVGNSDDIGAVEFGTMAAPRTLGRPKKTEFSLPRNLTARSISPLSQPVKGQEVEQERRGR
jgi:hypothetical protein